MTNLPATQNTTLASLGGQATLFDRPDLILEWSDEFLQTVTANICATGDNVLSQLRRATGLVAWAAWHRFEDGEYGRFVDRIAKSLGVDRRTIDRWRDAVVEKEDLEKPQLALIRAAEAAKRREDARQRRSITTLSTDLAPDSAIIETTATESRVAEKRVDSDVSDGEGRGDSTPAPSDPSSEGGEPSGETHSVSGSQPLSGEGTTPQRTEAVNRSDPDSPWVILTGPDRDRFLLDTLCSVSDQEAKSMADPYGPAFRAEVKRLATVYGFIAKETRRQGTVTTPADRAKAKLEAIPSPDPRTCEHPKAKHKKFGWGTVCECGVRVA